MSFEPRTIRLIPANSRFHVAFEFLAEIDGDVIERTSTAAQNQGPAPQLPELTFQWPENREGENSIPTLRLFGTDHEIRKPEGDLTAITTNVTVKGTNESPDEENSKKNLLVLEIASGSVSFSLVNEAGVSPYRILEDLSEHLQKVCPSTAFGTLTRIDLLPTGLGIHVKIDGETRAYQLEDVGPTSEGLPERLRWRHVAWPDEKYQQPTDRLSKLSSHIKALNSATGFQVVERLSDAHSGSVCVEVETTGADDSKAVEVFQPGWSLRIQGTTWKPRGLCLVNGNGNELRFTDGEYALFEDSPSVSEGECRVTWKDQKITADTLPSLTTTGQTSGGAANLPYLWQYGPIAEGERNEPGAWIRYRLDPQARTTSPAAARQVLEQSGFSSPVSIALSNQWQLELSPAPQANDAPSPARVDLVVKLNEDGKSFKEATLTVRHALVRALSPRIHVYRPRLADPSALPNTASLIDVLTAARLEFASDIADLSSESSRANSMQTAAKDLQLTATGNAVVAFVPGPEAGIQLVSWSGANLQHAPVEPGQRGGTAGSASRDYNQGLVPIQIDKFVMDQQKDSNYFDVTLSVTTSNPVSTESTAALLPWTTWKQASQYGDDSVTRKAFHRNLVQEHPEWETASVDQARNLVEPSTSTDENSDDRWSDLQRREEQLRDVRDAIRDQFAEAASRLSDDGTTVENWLDQVVFEPNTFKRQVKLDRDSNSTLPTLQGFHEDQALQIANNGSAPTGWLRAHLKWPVSSGENEGSLSPTLTVQNDASDGAFLADNSSIAMLHRYSDIVAMDAAVLHGRLFVFFADSQGKIYQWEPLGKDAEGEPVESKSLGIAPGFDKIEHIRATSYGRFLCLAVCSKKNVLAYHFMINDSDGRLELNSDQQEIAIESDPSNSITAVASASDGGSIVVCTGGTNHVTISRTDAWGSRLIFNQQVGGPVTAISFRNWSNKRFILGVARSNGRKIDILEWDRMLSTPATRHTVVENDVSGSETVQDLFIQPVEIGGRSLLQVVAAVTSENDSGTTREMRCWHLSQGDSDELVVNRSSKLDLPGTGNSDWASMAMDAPINENSQYLVIGSSGSDQDGKSTVGRWELDWSQEDGADVSAPRASSSAFGTGHLGTVKVVSVVREPGAEYLVTAGSDGTVRLWDAAFCQELRRCTAPDDPRWLDNLGVERSSTLIVDCDLWRVERLSVPEGTSRVEVRSVSTNQPIPLTSPGTDFTSDNDILFACLDLKLIKNGDDWKPILPDRLEQGCYGVYSNDEVSPRNWPRLCGVPIYVVGLEQVEFDESNGTVTHLKLQAVLANPAAWDGVGEEKEEEEEDEASIPAMVAEAVAAKKLLKLEFELKDGKFVLANTNTRLGDFYWRFDLADQLPGAASPSAFPGRLAVLSGTVKLMHDTLQLTPKTDASLASALGRLWKLDACPTIGWNTTNGGGFREAKDARALNPRRTFTDTENAPAIALERIGDRTDALTACKPDSPDKSDVLLRWDVETALEKTRYSQAVRTGALSVFRSVEANGSDAVTERLDALLVYADGSAGLWRLTESVKEHENWEATEFEAQEWNRYRLESTIEGVDVFEAQTVGDGATTARYFLFRCANGTAELWEETRGKIQEFSLAEAAITTAVFGPNLQAIFGAESLPQLWKRRRFVESISDIVLALGGSDGSVRIYVHSPDDEGSTRSVREFYDHRDPITSLSLAVDHSVPEANGPGLYLLVTSEKLGPPQLIELVTRSNSFDKSAANVGKLNSCHQFHKQVKVRKATWAMVTGFGEHVILLFNVPGNSESTNSLQHCFRQQPAEAKLFTQIEEINGLTPTELVAGISTSAPVFAVSRVDDGLRIVRFKATGGADTTTAVIQDSGDHKPLSIRLSGGLQHVLGIDGSDESVSLWCQTASQQNTWKKLHDNLPRRNDAKSVGFVDIPVPFLIHASDTEEGEVWDPELNGLRHRIPRGISGRPEWPRAFAILHGVPHLAVAENTIVRLWNLDTQEQVHLFLHDNDVAEIDLTYDAGTAWLLTRQSSSKKVTLWNVDELQSKDLGKAEKVRFAQERDSLKVLMAAFTDSAKPLTIRRATVQEFMREELPEIPSVTPNVELKEGHTLTAIKSIETLVHVHDTVRSTWTVVLAEIKNGSEDAKLQPHVLVFDLDAGTGPSRIIDPKNPNLPDIQAVTFGFPVGDGEPPRILVVYKNWGLKTFHLPIPDRDAGLELMAEVDLKGPTRADGVHPVAIFERSICSHRCLVILGKDGFRTGFYEVWELSGTSPSLVRRQTLSPGSLTLADVVIPGVFALDSSAELVVWERENAQRRIAITSPLGESQKVVWGQTFQNLATPLLVCGTTQGAFLLDLTIQTWQSITTVKDEQILTGASLIHPTAAGRKLRLVEIRISVDGVSNIILRAIEFSLSGVPTSSDVKIPDLNITLGRNARVVLVYSPTNQTRVIVATGVDENKICVLDWGNWELSSSDGLGLTVGPSMLAAASSQFGDTLYVVAGENNDLKLWELPSGQATSSTPWTINGSYRSVAIVATANGPQILAAGDGVAGIYSPRQLLRVQANSVPVFDLPIKLFDENDGGDNGLCLQGYINPARRLEVELKNAGRGLPETVPLQSAIMQSGYYGYLIDTPRAPRGNTGFLVCWGFRANSGMSGVVCVEEKPGAETETKANLAFNSGADDTIEMKGLRRRMRVFGFGEDAQKRSMEVISWELTGESDSQSIRLHIDDQPLALEGETMPNGDKPLILAHLHVTKQEATEQDGFEFQGYVPVQVEKDEDKDEYTFTLLSAVYAVEGSYRQVGSGVTRDDVVFPVLRSSENPLRGRAFDLVEAEPEEPTSGDNNAAIRFVSLAIQNEEIVLEPVAPQKLPIDLSLPPETYRLADRLPQAVPSLVHRHARGAQLRVWLPEFVTPHTKPLEEENLENEQDDHEDRRNLLRLVVDTPNGVKILADSLVFHPNARQRRWERSRSESLMFAHRSGDCVFGMGGLSLDNGASMGTLLNRCLELGATAEAIPLLDERAIREHLLETGNDGIIIERVLDGDGRLSYRFVSSPFHSVETAASSMEIEQESSPSPADSDENVQVDPLLLTPEQAAGYEFEPASRYRPTRPAPFPIFAGNETVQDSVALLRHLRYEYDGAKRPEPPTNVQLDEVTAFAARPARSAPPQMIARTKIDDSDETRPFLPTEFELRHGIDKPGAMFHHTARIVRDKQIGLIHIGGLADLAIREPQRFIPPSGAKVTLESTAIKPEADRRLPDGLKRIRVAWTEILGEVPLSDIKLVDNLTITPQEAEPRKYTLNDNRLFAFVVRIGEQLFHSTVDDRMIYFSRLPQQNSKTLNACELRLVTKVANLDNGVTVIAGGDNVEVSPYVVVTNGNGSDRTPDGDALPFSKAFTSEGKENEGYVVWVSTVEFLRMVEQAQGESDDPSNIGLDFVWLPPDQARDLGRHYSNAAKVFPEDCPSLRFVDVRQAAPRVAAVLRHANEHWLGKERTLFYGEAASVRGAKAEISPTNESLSLRLTASDAESLVVAWPNENGAEAKLLFVKYFDSGEAILGK